MRKFLVVLMILAAGSAFGATYYVDQTGGLDANTGLATDNAWKTIAKVNGSSFSAGDSILFKKGETWSGTSLVQTVSGAAGNPITFDAYGTGALPKINNIIATYAVATNAQYITFKNIHVDNTSPYAFIASGASNIIFDGVKATNIDNVEYDVGCIHLTQTDHSIVKNSTVDNCYTGIYVTHADSDNNLIQSNTITNSRNTGIAVSLGPTNTIVEHNNVSYSGLVINDIVGIGAYNPGTGTIMRYNISHHNGTAANQGGGFWVDGSGGQPPVQFYYNIAYANSATGFSLGGSSGSSIYNNTSWGNTGWVGGCAELNFYTAGDNVSNALIKNNIFYGDASCSLLNAPAGHITGHTIDYNLFFGGSATPFNWGGTSYSFAGYKTASSQDAHSVNSDPLFVSTVTPDFRLQSSSPAINAGVNVGLTQDYAGRVVPNGAGVDIGAYEWYGGKMSLPTFPSFPSFPDH